MKKLKILFLLLFTILLGSCKKDWLDYSPIDMYSAEIDYDDTNAPKHLNVAAVSIEPAKDDKQASLNTMKTMVEKIKSEHADIQVIVFGELITGWYYDESSKELYQRQLAETIDGESVTFVKTLAKENDVTIVFGFAEIDSETDNIFNSQVLIRPDGEIIKYRKRNLNELDKENKFTAGDELVVTDVYGVRAALFVCSDMQSDKITKEIADAKVDVILHSITSTTDLNAQISYVGMQMNTWIIFANRFGTEGDFEYSGFCQIINPAGTVSSREIGKNSYTFRKIGIFNK